LTNFVSAVVPAAIAGSHPLSLEARDPAKATLALEMLAGGETWEEVSNQTGYSFDQISRIRARHKVAIDKRKEQLAEDGLELAEGLRLLAKQKMAQLAENPDALAKVNIRDLVMSLGIAQDKFYMAAGEAKVTIEHRGNKPSLEDAMKAIEEAREKLKNVTPQETQPAIDT
jgi:uncharacterized protein with NRDE domain